MVEGPGRSSISLGADVESKCICPGGLAVYLFEADAAWYENRGCEVM
jgi:hypothetical protein